MTTANCAAGSSSTAPAMTGVFRSRNWPSSWMRRPRPYDGTCKSSRTRGSCVAPTGGLPIDSAGLEGRIVQRATQAMAEKGRIADAAIRLLDPCESLFIDEGSTAMAVAERLLAIERPLTVVTHSLSAAAVLTHRPTPTSSCSEVASGLPPWRPSGPQPPPCFLT